MRHGSRNLPALTAFAILSIVCICLWFARSGLFVSFTGDDLMNIFQAGRQPFSRTLLDNILYFSAGYRPMGTLVYRVMYGLFGLNTLAYRWVCYGLILTNLYILYLAARRLVTRDGAILAALILSYNAAFVDLYYNFGTIYDLLCFSFYLSALGLYIHVRKSGAFLSASSLAGLLLLYICALNSKEMAVTLPLILIVYEITFKPFSLAWLRWRPALICVLITLPYVLGKLSSGSPLTGNDAYRLHLGVRTYLRAMGHYLELFAYLSPGTLGVSGALTTLIALALIVVIARQRSLLFLWFFIVLTPLPIAFVGQRTGYAMYIPSFGIALFLAVIVVRLRREFALHIARAGSLSSGTARVLNADTFLLCLLLLIAFHLSNPLPGLGLTERAIQSTLAQLPVVERSIPNKSRVLFMDDPFPVEGYDLLYLVSLLYRASDLVVDRAKIMSPKPTPERINSYDYVFALAGDRWSLQPKSGPPAKP